MNILRLLLCAWGLSLVGCAAHTLADRPTPITANNPTAQPDHEVVQAILGKWFLEEHAPRHHPIGGRSEFEFLPDHTFIYTRVDYTPACEQRDSYTGTWHVSKGHLIQAWPKIPGNRPRTTESKILQISPSKTLTLSSDGTYEYYYRHPKLTTW